ncbi:MULTISPECIES: PHP domain-containing protein [unclassified Meiothermus]|uniref:PHP-associated domain-containing protein n=1 Tax=unclassified Meiothermus TaxID=370471 RepID=UPI000D7CD00F|nr:MULTISPECIES: PHP domain-containing protein [unclassified Meiothermus]PZA08879.1 PHP domain-containing protein [Meiothermus sp. Pnk-1]RYM33746.1 PHP domain-containing protein [Meiothermus sp. PNK-Is4]
MDQPKLPPEPTAEEVAAVGMVREGMMRIDLHCHSEASADCRTPLAAFPGRCKARGITVQAITDHNEIWGAQRLREMTLGSELTVIVGEEVSSRDGEIIGLFLREKIPAGLSAEETVERIKAQGGLVLLPHGFDPLKRYRLTPSALERIAGQIDIVESFNARISRPTWNRAAAQWADERGLPKSAGSDAHTLAQVGAAWVQAPQRPIHTPADLLAALREGTVMGEWTHPVLAFVQKLWDMGRKRMMGA